jgi:nucleoside-diphosphate-sugar epimerase
VKSWKISKISRRNSAPEAIEKITLTTRNENPVEIMPSGHILVTGATGLIGRAAMEHFARLGMKTTAVSRRRPFETYGADFLSVDLADEAACRVAFGGMTDITQIVFAALHEEPDLVSGWTSQAHVDRNGAMLRNTLEVVAKVAPGLRNVTILQGPKAYGAHVRSLRPASREDLDEDRSIPNFYWAQEDYLKARQHGQAWGWTIFRPCFVMGMAIGGAMNVLAAIGVYAALLKARGEPLHYPGPRGNISQPSDTDLMATAFAWAATADAARNQVFNIDNGELFSLADQWPVIAECLGMEVGEDRAFSFLEDLPPQVHEWNAIRGRYNLIAPSVADFLGSSAQFADWVLTRPERVQPGTISTIKLRQAGFNETLYSEAMFRKWFARYQASHLLPPR